jgi:hypothetical protein
MSACPGILAMDQEVPSTVPAGSGGSIEHCPGCKEAAQLRAQLAQRTAALQKIIRYVDIAAETYSGAHRLAPHVATDCQTYARQALADLPEAPKEKP